MCSRYYIDKETVLEAGKLIKAKHNSTFQRMGDIHPNENAPVILREQHDLQLKELRWGFLQHTGKGLIINARTETALMKPSFSESMLYRRCVMPAQHFYEWDAQKIKVTF